MGRLTDVLDKSRVELSQSITRHGVSVKGHARIAAAIRRRDADAAHHAMRTHLDEIEKIIFKSEESINNIERDDRPVRKRVR